MRRLTESLLELARVEGGAGRARAEVDLAKIAAETVELLSPLAEKKGVRLECELGPAQCVGDAGELMQVAVNLLSNAVQFTEPGGRVWVRTGGRRLEVEDEGCGISSEDLTHLFERFYRVDKARSRSEGHAGLGLAIAQAIVEAHGGRLRAESEVGRGSKFAVEL